MTTQYLTDSTFTSLEDTPSTYTSQNNKILTVNNTADGVEFKLNSIDNLTNVEITDATYNDILIYDYSISKWENTQIGQNTLADTTITSPTEGDIMQYTGGVWKNISLISSGSWTPIIRELVGTDFTITITNAWYYKIDKICTCSFYVTVTNLNGLTTEIIRLKGLPFTIQSNIGSSPQFGFIGESAAITEPSGYSGIYLQLNTNTTYGTFYTYKTTPGWDEGITANDVNLGAGRIQGSIIYITT